MSTASVPDLAPRIAHVATGDAAARASFAFAFPVADTTDLQVFLDGSALEGGFSVDLNAEGPGGVITLASPAPEGAEIVILRATRLERATDFVENGAFRASALNQELNRLTMMAQELSLALKGGLYRPASEAGAMLVLPGASARASGLLGFGPDGTEVVIRPLDELRGEKGETGPQGLPGDMHGSMNLAELTDPAAARANLSVPSQAETDAALAGVDAALDGLEKNLALNTLRDVIASGWSLLDMIDGFADAFVDQTGVDVDPAESAPLWGTPNASAGTLSNGGTTFSANNTRWVAATGALALSTGKRYFEVEHNTVWGGDNVYQAHGLASVETFPDTNTYLQTGSWALFHHGRVSINGATLVDKSGGAFDAQIGTWAPAGTKGCVAVDFEAGKAWLGFVTQWGCPWWVDGGRPEDGHNPTFTFTPNTPLRPLGWNYTNVLTINTGRSAFQNKMIPRGFIPGWFETDGMVDGPYGPNIAPTGTASSLYGGAGPGNVIDQNLDTSWGAASSGTQQHIRVSFAEPKTATRVIIRRQSSGLSNLTQLRIRGSNDLTSWTDLASKTTGITTLNQDHIFDIASPGAYLHYELLGDYSVANGMAIHEFQIYEAVPVVNTVGGLSIGQTYDAAGDFYGNYPTPANLIPTMTGQSTGGVTITDSAGTTGTYAPWKAGNKAVSAATDAWVVTATAPVSLIVDFGSERTFDRYTIQRTPSGWTNDFASMMPNTWALEVSNDGADWTTVDSRSAQTWGGVSTRTFVCSGVCRGRYARLRVTANNGSAYIGLGEFEIAGAAVQAMELVSEPWATGAMPVAARAVLLVDPLEAVTLNTDLIVEISRDDGVTWNAGSLVVAAQESPAIQVLATEEVDLSAQPDGQAMRIRLRAPTGKAVWVHAWALQWR